MCLQAALREQPSVVMLVGNKSDKMEGERQVGLEEGRLLAVVRQSSLLYSVCVCVCECVPHV